MGNEGDGMHERERRQCDFFVYISHYGSGTASLNVTVASSIIFHHFGLWAGYTERIRQGQKFVVAAPVENELTREIAENKRMQRRAEKAERQAAFEEGTFARADWKDSDY